MDLYALAFVFIRRPIRAQDCAPAKHSILQGYIEVRETRSLYSPTAITLTTHINWHNKVNVTRF